MNTKAFWVVLVLNYTIAIAVLAGIAFVIFKTLIHFGVL